MSTDGERIGELCVRKQLISPAQLNHALSIQKRQARSERVGDLLVALGYISRDQLRKIVEESGHRELFGEMLLHQGVLTREQLDQALDRQTQTGRQLGQVLLEMHLLDEQKLARALSHQLDLSYVVPQPNLVNMAVFNRLPAAFIREKRAVPVSEEGGTVTVWVADPTDPTLRSSLRGRLNADVRLAVGTPSGIDGLIDGLLLRERFRRRATGREGVSDGGMFVAERLVISSRDMAAQDTESASGILDYLIWDALKQRASDIHIEPTRGQLQVRYRIDGVLARQCEFPLTLGKLMFKRAETLARLEAEAAEPHREGLIQSEIDGEMVDLRLAISRTVTGCAMVIRLFPQRTGLIDLKTVGMLPSVQKNYLRAIERASGVVFLSGPKASGKTTTLYATLRYLNDGSRKIVTMESPAACVLEGVVQTNVTASQRAAIPSIMSGLLQHDPDVMAMGETASAHGLESVLRCAVMGHKTFGVLHADDTAAVLVQLIQTQEFTSMLRSCEAVVLTQRLVRRVCENCARESAPSGEFLREFPFAEGMPDTVRWRHGLGCGTCRGTGFAGRTGIFEMLVVGPEIRDLSLKNPSVNDLRAAARKDRKFISLKQAGLLKVCQGMTTLDEVRRVMPAFELDTADETHESFIDLCRRAGVELGGAREGGAS